MPLKCKGISDGLNTLLAKISVLVMVTNNVVLERNIILEFKKIIQQHYSISVVQAQKRLVNVVNMLKAHFHYSTVLIIILSLFSLILLRHLVPVGQTCVNYFWNVINYIYNYFGVQSNYLTWFANVYCNYFQNVIELQLHFNEIIFHTQMELLSF